ncbi:MAG: PD-(D/E)XK nuclease family protein [Rhodobacteraceae bacterium]|nr:PD-(D/E)XK nuclease family protein [Paracoccaceae bacterium]
MVVEKLSSPPDHALQYLEERSGLGWLRERDIDLLICSELHAREALNEHFAQFVTSTSSHFFGAWVSHSEFDGESDLVVAFSGTNSLFKILLIENKIAAAFQPDQGRRYAERATRWKVKENVEQVITVLMAPSGYAERAGSEEFERFISYEDICDLLRGATDARSEFLSKCLAQAVEDHKSGYVAVPHEGSTKTWQKIQELSCTVAPKLAMKPSGSRPSGSSFIYFRDALGLEEYRQLVNVVYKAERGQVDLQFKATSVAELAKLAGPLISDHWKVAKASKSASIRIGVPKIDFANGMPNEADVIEGLSACEKLRGFFCDNEDVLETLFRERKKYQ